MPIKRRHSNLIIASLDAATNQTLEVSMENWDNLMFLKTGGGGLSLRTDPSLQPSQNAYVDEAGNQVELTANNTWLLVPGPLPSRANLFLGSGTSTVAVRLSREIG